MEFIVTESQRRCAELKGLLEKASKLRDQAEQNAAELQAIAQQIERLQKESAKPSRRPSLTGQ